MIFRLFIILFLLFPQTVHARTYQVINMGPRPINTGATTFFTIMGDAAASTTEGNRQTVAPSAGTFTGLRVKLSAAPNNGPTSQTVRIRLRVDNANSVLTCIITEDETTCTSNAVVTVTAGQLLGFTEVPANIPTASNVEVSMYYIDGTGNYSILQLNSGTNLTIVTNTPTYFSLATGILNNVGSEANVQVPIPTSGTLRSLYVAVSVAPANGGGTQTYVFTVMKNGASTSLACTISEAATTCNDTTNTVSVVAGDTITVRVVPNATPAASLGKIGLVFQSNTEGEFIMAGGRDASMDTVNTTYKGFNSAQAWNTTEGSVDQATQTMVLKALYIDINGDPDLGIGIQSYLFTLRAGAVATGCTCEVDSGAQTCNDTCSDGVVVDSQMSIENVPGLVPTALEGYYSILGFNNPDRRVLIP